MGDEEERGAVYLYIPKKKKSWILDKTITEILTDMYNRKIINEEEEEERNDVCIYKTLRYPPKSTPPTAN